MLQHTVYILHVCPFIRTLTATQFHAIKLSVDHLS